MNIFKQIKTLIKAGKIKISSHGYDELAADNIFVRDIISSIENAEVLENYLEFPKGPCVLLLQVDKNDSVIHTLWGIPKGHAEPAVLITAYRPDTKKWKQDLRRRKK